MAGGGFVFSVGRSVSCLLSQLETDVSDEKLPVRRLLVGVSCEVRTQG